MVTLIAPDSYDITNGYFTTVGQPRLEGRDFTEADNAGAPVVIVNQVLAQREWPGKSAIGHRIRTGELNSWATVVGVMGSLFAYTSTASADTSASLFPIKHRMVVADFKPGGHIGPRRCGSCRTVLEVFGFHEARSGNYSSGVLCAAVENKALIWLPPRDSNPDMLLQRMLPYRSCKFLRFPLRVCRFLSSQSLTQSHVSRVELRSLG